MGRRAIAIAIASANCQSLTDATFAVRMRCIFSAVRWTGIASVIAIVITICCTDSIFAYSTGSLPLESVLARINRAPPHSVSHAAPNATGDGERRGPRIVGGSKTTIENVPYQVSLHYYARHICGGSIISYQWVLTAAHCLDWYPKNNEISVRTGSTSHAVGGLLHEVFHYHLHERYDAQEFQWDVATVRIRTPMVGLGRGAIALPSLGREWSNETTVTVTGWGYSTTKGKVVTDLLLVRLNVVSRETCNRTWTGYIMEDMICAGGIGVDACDGDSGGPAVQDGVQYGIISWGAIDCGNGLPGVFTNVAHPSVRDFIRRTTMV